MDTDDTMKGGCSGVFESVCVEEEDSFVVCVAGGE